MVGYMHSILRLNDELKIGLPEAIIAHIFIVQRASSNSKIISRFIDIGFGNYAAETLDLLSDKDIKKLSIIPSLMAKNQKVLVDEILVPFIYEDCSSKWTFVQSKIACSIDSAKLYFSFEKTNLKLIKTKNNILRPDILINNHLW